MSIDSRTPTSPDADQQPVKPEPSAPRLSTLQIVASALAAMTTTALLATLGVAGTIIGAALASVITVLANFVYTASLSRTADKVATAAVKKSRSRLETTVTGTSTPPRSILVAGEPVAVDGAAADPDDAALDGATTSPAQRPGALRSVIDRYGWRRIGGAIAVVFALVLAAVTVIELTAGRPLTDVVRNQEGSGTSLFGTGTAPSEPTEEAPRNRPAEVPAPTPDETVPPEPVEPPTPAPTETPTPQEPAPTPPAEGETPEDSPTSPAPVDEPTQPPADDAAPGAAPQPVPEPTPTPEPTPAS